MNTSHGNQLDLLTVPKFSFWAKAGKVFTAEVIVLRNVFFYPFTVDLGDKLCLISSCGIKEKSFLCIQYFFTVSVKGKSEEFLFIDNKYDIFTVTEINYSSIVVIGFLTKCNSCILAHLTLANLKN